LTNCWQVVWSDPVDDVAGEDEGGGEDGEDEGDGVAGAPDGDVLDPGVDVGVAG
jgi:hypothetical protein